MDTIRDNWDKAALIIGVVSAAFSIVIGIIAIRLARRANKHADEAKQLSADAELRAIERAARERSRQFDLELLRDLMEIASATDLHHKLSPVHFRARTVAALRILGKDELHTWREIGNSSGVKEIGMRFAETEEERAGVGRPMMTEMLPYTVAEKVREALLQDVEAAIDKRMEERADEDRKQLRP